MAVTYKNVVVQTTNTPTTVYTAPASTKSIVLMFQAANNDTAGNYTITVTVTDSSASITRYLARSFNIPLNTSISLLDGKLVLDTGDYIQISSDTTGKIDVIMSIAEVV